MSPARPSKDRSSSTTCQRPDGVNGARGASGNLLRATIPALTLTGYEGSSFCAVRRGTSGMQGKTGPTDWLPDEAFRHAIRTACPIQAARPIRDTFPIQDTFPIRAACPARLEERRTRLDDSQTLRTPRHTPTSLGLRSGQSRKPRAPRSEILVFWH